MKLFSFLLIFVVFFTGCSYLGYSNRPAVTPFAANVESDSLQQEIAFRNIIIDSLNAVISNLNYSVDSLSQALEISNSRVAVNTEFHLPDSVMFAGYVFDLTNERYYDKLETIYQQELKSAHKFIPRTGRYFPLIDSVFSEHNVPLDAKYMAIAESRLSPLAYSRVGAVGMWQFMNYTAKGYGLQVNSFIDERKNVIKSTVAAAKLLQSNYAYLKNKRDVEDWLLAMSGYNAGIGNISKAIKEQNGHNFFEIMMKSDESHNFVWRALAAKIIIENQEEIFGKEFDLQKPLLEETKSVHLKLKGHYKIDEWATARGTTVNKVWENNPWIKIYQRSRSKYSPVIDVVLPPGEYDIFTPADSDANLDELAKIEKNFLNSNAGYFTHHTVVKGDNLYDIARKYKTSVSKIKALNGLGSNTIYPGQKLKLYGSTSAATTNTYYVVKKGESVSGIASKLGVSSKHLIAKNNLVNKNGIVLINPGQKLYY